MPYFALVNETATIGLSTPEEMESYVDEMILKGHYKPFEDNLITVSIHNMKLPQREVVKMYLWDFEGEQPEKVED